MSLTQDNTVKDGCRGLKPDLECLIAVHAEVQSVLLSARPGGLVSLPARLGRSTLLAAEDLLALTDRDPAALGSWRYVLDSYSSFRAVLAHRLASTVLRRSRTCDPERAAAMQTLARRISEHTKVTTGVEIHPGARIGRRFVLDHGTGTVIGETTTIGTDCYVLQGVVLGATGIAGNDAGKRHPTLGDRVQVGAFAQVLGPVRVGSDVFVGPGATVTSDVPDGSRVRVATQCQISRPAGRASFFGAVPVNASVFDVYGVGLEGVYVELLEAVTRVRSGLTVETLHVGPGHLRCRIGGQPGRRGPVDELLRIVEPTGEELVVTALRRVWKGMRALPQGLEVAP